LVINYAFNLDVRQSFLSYIFLNFFILTWFKQNFTYEFVAEPFYQLNFQGLFQSWFLSCWYKDLDPSTPVEYWQSQPSFAGFNWVKDLLADRA